MSPRRVTLSAVELRRSLNGALAGGLAAAVWAAQQPLDKRAFHCRYDDLELLGKAVTRGPAWPSVGLALHLVNGALFGAAYASLRPSLPGPPVARALLAALAENFGLWPLTMLSDRHHPARDELPPLSSSTRALAQATWRHALFGIVLGLLEERLNRDADGGGPEVEFSVNGHGDIERAVATAG